MANIAKLPVLADGGLTQYIESIKRFPMLTQEDEVALANKWIDNQDVDAAQSLVTSHLRLVVKIAMGFRGYGLPVTDIISEGNIGLMQAVKRFDPKKGFRLSTYAMWWIKAAINEYVLRSWSLVKMGTTAAQKKLFYNLRRMKERIIGAQPRNLLPTEISQIAHDLNVSECDVVEMNDRLQASDSSLNTHVHDEDNSEFIDFLSDERDNQEVIYAQSEELAAKQKIMKNAMSQLNEREQDIILQRRMIEPAMTLEDLSIKYKVSKERIRQIENRAIEKLQESVQLLA